jgi:uridine monophosphate synthetase
MTLLTRLSYHERAAMTSHPVAQELFTVMEDKESNLVLGVDVLWAQDLLNLAELLGPSICMIKTHIDMIRDFSSDVTKRLQEIADRHNFLIFEDRKFADIGMVVKEQYLAGCYNIAEWSHLTNAHIISGPAIIQALREGALEREGNPTRVIDRGLLLIAQMSSAGALVDADYRRQCVELAEKNSDFVMGFICQEKISEDPRLIHFSPGVKIQGIKDELGQQYNSPEAMFNRGIDVVIVGRGITQSDNPKEEAEVYRRRSWDAYNRVI